MRVQLLQFTKRKHSLMTTEVTKMSTRDKCQLKVNIVALKTCNHDSCAKARSGSDQSGSSSQFSLSKPGQRENRGASFRVV